MKIKTTPIISIFSLTLVLCGCSEPAQDNSVNSSNEIIDVWYHELNWGDNFILRDEINFLSNGNHERFSKLYDRSTRDFLGYMGREEGTYKVEESNLTLFNTLELVTPDGLTPQMDMGGLVSFNGARLDRFGTVKLNDERTVLRIRWMCGTPNTLCMTISNPPFFSYRRIK